MLTQTRENPVKLARHLLLLLLAGCASAAGTGSGASGNGAPFDLVVLSTTDIHGRLRGWDYYADSAESSRGLARAATVVDSVRTANPGRVLLLDAGEAVGSGFDARRAVVDGRAEPVFEAHPWSSKRSARAACRASRPITEQCIFSGGKPSSSAATSVSPCIASGSSIR